MTRSCRGISVGGERCLAPPRRGGDFCFWHDPEHEADAKEAQRLGGLRRKREGTILGAYDFDGLNSVAQLRRILEIAVIDAIALENSVQRVRAIIAGVQAGAKLLEVGELEERLEAVEAALGPRLPKPLERRNR